VYESSDEEMEIGDHQATPTSPSLPPRVPKHDLMMVEEVSSPFPHSLIYQYPKSNGTNLCHFQMLTSWPLPVKTLPFIPYKYQLQ
jgi:hypothetical protein